MQRHRPFRMISLGLIVRTFQLEGRRGSSLSCNNEWSSLMTERAVIWRQLPLFFEC